MYTLREKGIFLKSPGTHLNEVVLLEHNRTSPNEVLYVIVAAGKRQVTVVLKVQFSTSIQNPPVTNDQSTSNSGTEPLLALLNVSWHIFKRLKYNWKKGGLEAIMTYLAGNNCFMCTNSWIHDFLDRKMFSYFLGIPGI